MEGLGTEACECVGAHIGLSEGCREEDLLSRVQRLLGALLQRGRGRRLVTRLDHRTRHRPRGRQGRVEGKDALNRVPRMGVMNKSAPEEVWELFGVEYVEELRGCAEGDFGGCFGAQERLHEGIDSPEKEGCVDHLEALQALGVVVLEDVHHGFDELEGHILHAEPRQIEDDMERLDRGHQTVHHPVEDPDHITHLERDGEKVG